MHKYKQFYLTLCLLIFCPLLSFAAIQEQARECIKKGRIGDAVALYAQLVSALPDNPEISMEYAYSLALSQLQENALIYLDKANRQGCDKKTLSFYVSQVFSLMGYSDMAAEFWKPTESEPPQWLAEKYEQLFREYAVRQKINSDTPDSAFVRANVLAAKKQYFQSLVLFHELEQTFPENYLPYAGSSLVWEKMDKSEIAAQKLDTCIVLINRTLRDDSLSRDDIAVLNGILPAFNEHLKKLQSKDLLHAKISEPTVNSKYIVYASGILSSTVNSLNIGCGSFFSGTDNFSANLGVSSSNGSALLTLGLSSYHRKNSWVSGYGLNLQLVNGNKVLNYSGSVGYSFFNNVKNRSTDIFFIYGFPITPWNLKEFMVGISIGQSLYFGKRK